MNIFVAVLVALTTVVDVTATFVAATTATDSVSTTFTATTTTTKRKSNLINKTLNEINCTY